MSSINQPERTTQNRVVALFRHELRYRYLGDWTDRDGNSNSNRDGNDTNDGATATTACATIQKAVSTAGPGDTIAMP